MYVQLFYSALDLFRPTVEPFPRRTLPTTASSASGASTSPAWSLPCPSPKLSAPAQFYRRGAHALTHSGRQRVRAVTAGTVDPNEPPKHPTLPSGCICQSGLAILYQWVAHSSVAESDLVGGDFNLRVTHCQPWYVATDIFRVLEC